VLCCVCAVHRRLGQIGRRPALHVPLPGCPQSWLVGGSRALQGCWPLLGSWAVRCGSGQCGEHCAVLIQQMRCQEQSRRSYLAFALRMHRGRSRRVHQCTTQCRRGCTVVAVAAAAAGTYPAQPCLHHQPGGWCWSQVGPWQLLLRSGWCGATWYCCCSRMHMLLLVSLPLLLPAKLSELDLFVEGPAMLRPALG
jgi:hypothetical protein